MAKINAICGICGSLIHIETEGPLTYREEELYKSWKLTHDLYCIEKADEVPESEGGEQTGNDE